MTGVKKKAKYTHTAFLSKMTFLYSIKNYVNIQTEQKSGDIKSTHYLIVISCRIHGLISLIPYQDLTRLPSKAKAQMASGQRNHWLIDSPSIVHLCVTRPPGIFINFIFKHIHAAYDITSRHIVYHNISYYIIHTWFYSHSNYSIYVKM